MLKTSLIQPSIFLLAMLAGGSVWAQSITTDGQPAQLNIRPAGEHSIRVTLKPIGYTQDFPSTPALAERNYPAPAIS